MRGTIGLLHRRPAAALVALLALLGLAAAAPAAAQEFRSVAPPVAILYDAPSTKARRLFVVTQGYPLRVESTIQGWARVRDAAGDITWIESSALSSARTVLVRAPATSVRTAATDAAPLAFQAVQGVWLELLAPPEGEWVRVRHRDGTAGFARTRDLWGL
jgi:SH3-like domain-containing protein